VKVKIVRVKVDYYRKPDLHLRFQSINDYERWKKEVDAKEVEADKEIRSCIAKN